MEEKRRDAVKKKREDEEREMKERQFFSNKMFQDPQTRQMN